MAPLDRSTVTGAIDSLVAKSMVSTRPIGAMMRYRLLDTTRAYALEIKIDDTELADLAVRHATYYRRWLEQTGTEWPTLSTGTERAPHFAGLNNVRAALEWCFGGNGNVEIGVGLAAAAAPVFLAMSLLPECHRWSERALLALDDESRGGREEMQLQACLGHVVDVYPRSQRRCARRVRTEALPLPKRAATCSTRCALLGLLHMYHLRGGDFRTSLQYAKRSSEIAGTLGDAGATALAHALMGISLHLMGNLNDARIQLEAALEPGPDSPISRTTYFGFDHYRFSSTASNHNPLAAGSPGEGNSTSSSTNQRCRADVRSGVARNHAQFRCASAVDRRSRFCRTAIGLVYLPRGVAIFRALSRRRPWPQG